MKTKELHEKASKLMPQGVAENYRYWGDKTIFIQRSQGCYLYDCNGKKYADFRLGYGPIILGHADSRVDKAVISQIQESGTLCGFSSPIDIEVVEKIKNLCPNIEKLRFANSGTEAVFGAIRTARAYTKKNHVAIVEGGFHGLNDEMMWRPDYEGNKKHIIPMGTGLSPSSKDYISYIQMNNFEDLDDLFRNYGDQLAAVLLEPIIGNAGSISANQNWLRDLQQRCNNNGSLLILDEVKSGFRVAKGGAQQIYDICADLTTYAKAMGNGYPIAAFGGKAKIMDIIGPHEGGVVHGGTYSANLIGMTAANKTLEILTNTNAMDTIFSVGEQIKQVLSRVFSKASIEHVFAGPSSMFGIHFSNTVPSNYRDWYKTNSELYKKFAWNLIDLGVMLEPDSREPWFICQAHKDLDLIWLEDVATIAMKKALDKTL